MQQLSEELKNTPRNVKLLLVPCSVNSQLNKEETLSVENIILTDNIPKGVQSQHTEKLKAKVYVIAKEGHPLMPCSCAKAKKLLRAGKARVVKRIPFTIQLSWICENKTQDVTLGIDVGYSNIGFSAISEKSELISGTLVLENGMTKRLQEKLMYRRGRRNKLWYRKPRFLNRGIKEGWLPPSVIRRFQTHVSLIERIKKLLPISKIRIEIANFDIQKIENPEISGKDYQQGTMYEYRNRIAYLISREKGKCQYCDKEYHKNNGWRLHHIFGKEKDRPQDWALLHEKCHDEIHSKKLEHVLQKQKSKSYKDSAFMNIVRWKFKETFPEAEITYGNITFQNRCDLNLEKNHINDAFVIANGKNQNRIKEFVIEQKRKHNRTTQLNRKGYKPSIKTHIYKIQPKDLIWYLGKLFTVVGIQNKGMYVKVKDYKKVIPVKKIERLYHFGSFVWNV